MSRKPYYSRSSRPLSDVPVVDDELAEGKASRRTANVYDAVAGHVTQSGLIGNIRDVKSSRQPLRPDEVLFKQANAPVRYEETDYYNAHTRLPRDRQLPDGELLTAIHAYVSKLYSRTAEGDNQHAWKCMDETALIAFGILVEETAREVLGETGDFAFVEAADDNEERILGQGSEDEEAEVGSSISRDVSQEASVEVDTESSEDNSRYSTEDSE